MGSQSVHKGRKKDDDGELIEFPHFFSRLNKRAVIPSRIERDRAELVWPETKKATRHSSNPARRCCQRPVSPRANRRNSAISARDHPANRKRAKRRAPTRTNTHTHTTHPKRRRIEYNQKTILSRLLQTTKDRALSTPALPRTHVKHWKHALSNSIRKRLGHGKEINTAPIK